MRLLLAASLSFMVAAAAAQRAARIKKLDGSTVSAAAVTARLQQLLDSAGITGLSVVILNGNHEVYQHTFGVRNKEKNLPLQAQTEMYAASFTKPVSAYLFLKLASRGLFNLDSPLVRYLKKPIADYEKWADLAADKDFNRITPRLLLSHQGGLPIMRYLYNNKVNLIAPPGSRFYYSNEGMNLLGFVIEQYTGRRLEELAAELVFTPLGMNHSSYIWLPAFDSNYALGYDRRDSLIGIGKRTAAKAAGSMTTVAADYAKFVRALLEKKGLPPALVNEMMRPQIRVRSRRGFGPQRDSLGNYNKGLGLAWGLGLGLFQSRYGPAFFHAGHDEGWNNYFVAYPQRRLAIVLMSNSSRFEPTAAKILAACLGDRDSPLAWLGYYDTDDN